MALPVEESSPTAVLLLLCISDSLNYPFNGNDETRAWEWGENSEEFLRLFRCAVAARMSG